MSSDDTARVRAYAEDKERINGMRQGPDDTQAEVIRRLLNNEEQDRVTTTGDDPLAMYEDFRDVIQDAVTEAIEVPENKAQRDVTLDASEHRKIAAAVEERLR
mgnify:CR=1 FL=1